MTSIALDVDIAQFVAGMDELEKVQIPFAKAKAINALAIDVQLRERERLREVFTIRLPAWADRSIKIDHFATKNEPWARIAIAPPGGDKADILGKFEDQTEKSPLGIHGIAVPVDARKNKRDLIVAAQRPREFHLHREGNRIVGDQGTYILQLPDGRQLLLQRPSLGKRAAKKAGRGTNERASLLYIFVPRVKIKPDLQFVPSAAQVVERLWEQRFGEAFTLAMTTAR